MLNQLEVLKEKNILLGNQELVSKLAAMLDASNRIEAQVSTIQAISTSIIQSNDLDKSTKETNLGQACQGSQEQDRSGIERKVYPDHLKTRMLNFMTKNQIVEHVM